MLEGTFIWRVQNFFLVAIKQFIRKTIVQAVLFVFDLASCFGGPFICLSGSDGYLLSVNL